MTRVAFAQVKHFALAFISSAFGGVSLRFLFSALKRFFVGYKISHLHRLADDLLRLYIGAYTLKLSRFRLCKCECCPRCCFNASLSDRQLNGLTKKIESLSPCVYVYVCTIHIPCMLARSHLIALIS